MRTNQMSISFIVNTITHRNGTRWRGPILGPTRSRPDSRSNLLIFRHESPEIRSKKSKKKVLSVKEDTHTKHKSSVLTLNSGSNS